MGASTLSTFPFYLHAVLETAASFHFWANALPSSASNRPDQQLADTLAIYRQYAVLLFCSVLIALIFARRRVIDSTSRLVAGSLAIYHLAPFLRAWGRLRDADWRGEISRAGQGDLGGPCVHLVAHMICCLALMRLCLLEGAQKSARKRA